MTTDTEFLRVFNRLCVALREPPDDTGIMQQTYFELLHDLPIQALDAGAVALMQEPGRKFFPTSAEWRQAAAQAGMDALRAALPPARVEPWRHEDPECEDTGWRFLDCDGASGACGREKKHAPHSYVTICACRPTNHTFHRHRVCS